MNGAQIAEIRARCEAATPGPWIVSNGRDKVCAKNVPAYADKTARVVVADCMKENNGRRFEEDYAMAQRDAEFIAHARQDIPALLDEVERLTEENKRLNRKISDISKMVDDFIQKVMITGGSGHVQVNN